MTFRIQAEVTEEQLTKAVSVHPTKYKRAYLEIFKMFPGAHVAANFSKVNREWYTLSWDEDLWRHACELEFEAGQV